MELGGALAKLGFKVIGDTMTAQALLLCDCLNDCGDDPKIRNGEIKGCEEFKRRERINAYENGGGFKQVVKALQFYAEAKNWSTTSTGFAAQYDPEPRPIDVDHGAQAKAALELIPLELRT